MTPLLLGGGKVEFFLTEGEASKVEDEDGGGDKGQGLEDVLPDQVCRREVGE